MVEMMHHIKELLKTHDCVIIPGLGGLIGHSEPARRNLAAGTMSPPMKRIAFNRMLRQNDGLLINYIARIEHLSYDLATKQVESFKNEVEQALRLHKSYLFSGLGKLSYSDGDKLQFYPILKENLLLDTYNMPLIVAQPVIRVAETVTSPESIIPMVDPDADEVILPEAEVPVYKPWMFRVAAMIGIGFLMTTAGISVVNGDLSGEQLSILPAQQTVIRSSMIVTLSTASINADLEFQLFKEIEEEVADHEEILPLEFTTDVVDDVQQQPDSKATIDHIDNKFYIIVGSYLNLALMQQEISNLEARGYHVETLPGPNGYTRVGLTFDGDKVSKQSTLRQIRDAVHPEAWMINS